MRKTYLYRIYPTKKQANIMNQWLEECRWLFNHLLEQRKNAWEESGVSLSLYGQQSGFPNLKQQRNSLTSIHSAMMPLVDTKINV